MQQVWGNSVSGPRPRCSVFWQKVIYVLGSRKCRVNDRILHWIVWSFFFLPSRRNLRVGGNESRDTFIGIACTSSATSMPATLLSVRLFLFFPTASDASLSSPVSIEREREREGAKKEPPVEFPD